MGGWGGRVTALQAFEPPLTLQLTSPAILRGMLAISAQILQREFEGITKACLWAKTVCVRLCLYICVCEYACMCVREHVCFPGKNELFLNVCVCVCHIPLLTLLNPP